LTNDSPTILCLAKGERLNERSWPKGANSLASPERLLLRRNGRRILRARDQEGLPATVQSMERTLAESIADVHE
jgi:hypothetical protein